VKLVQVEECIEKTPREFYSFRVKKILQNQVPWFAGLQKIRKLAHDVFKLDYLAANIPHLIALLSVEGKKIVGGQHTITVKITNIEPIPVARVEGVKIGLRKNVRGKGAKVAFGLTLVKRAWFYPQMP